MKSTGQDNATQGHKPFDYEHQTPVSVGYCIVSSFPQFEVVYKSKVGEDWVNWFIKELLEFEKQAMSFYYDEKRLEWNDSLDYEFRTATLSHLQEGAEP